MNQIKKQLVINKLKKIKNPVQEIWKSEKEDEYWEKRRDEALKYMDMQDVKYLYENYTSNHSYKVEKISIISRPDGFCIVVSDSRGCGSSVIVKKFKDMVDVLVSFMPWDEDEMEIVKAINEAEKTMMNIVDVVGNLV